MEILKAHPDQFKDITDFPYTPRYVHFRGIDMHYIDEGQGEIILALHGEPSWCYLYRKFIPILAPEFRFVAPDFIGFGKSDKIVGIQNYTFELHYESVKHFIQTLELKDITLVVQDWGGLLGLSVLGEHPEWFKRVVIMNTFLPKGKRLGLGFRAWQAFARYHPNIPISWIIDFATTTKLSKAVKAAYDAPFPTRKHKHAANAFPPMVPGRPDAPGVLEMQRARQTLSTWEKPALVLFSDKDPILGGMEGFFYKLIPTANDQPKIIVKDAGHFLQEDKGEEIAGYIQQFMQGTLK